MVFDYSKLKGRIIEKFGTVSAFAESMGYAQSGLYISIKHGKPISSKRIIEMTDALEIESKDVGEFFYTPKV